MEIYEFPLFADTLSCYIFKIRVLGHLGIGWATKVYVIKENKRT